MATGSEKADGTDLDRELRAMGPDFPATYMAVKNLRFYAKTRPEILEPRAIHALGAVLTGTEHASQSNSRFLYLESARTLVDLLVNAVSQDQAVRAFDTLSRVALETAGKPRMAACESLGLLPVAISGPDFKEKTAAPSGALTWEQLLKKARVRAVRAGFVGRSIVAEAGDKVFVVKLARNAKDSPQMLCREAAWMEHLGGNGYSFPTRFDIPCPVPVGGKFVFRLKGMPLRSLNGLDLHPKGYALGFTAPKDYFTYPNDHREGKRLSGKGFKDVMSRSARLMGRLASLGILHTAPIPLFHNRLQQERRNDHGLYLWERMGRLDRWFHSCRYPNFGLSGLRDFEHLVSFNGHGRELYRGVGAHLLGMLLVAGSYFRAKDPDRMGVDAHGEPVDARDLFDRDALEGVVQEIFKSYYHGFVGQAYRSGPPLDTCSLAERMIEEMGVDRHMGETLRLVDQEAMRDEEFRDFLLERGYSRESAARMRRGDEDVVIPTGPHLGDFNSRISLPEIIEFVALASASCISARYFRENIGTSLWELRSTSA